MVIEGPSQARRTHRPVLVVPLPNEKTALTQCVRTV